MSRAAHLELGRAGEDLAASHLSSLGWRMIERNVRVGAGELDIVAMDGDELVVVEVRSRSIGDVMPPESSVGPRKLRKLIKAAKRYVLARRYGGNWRIDVAAVTVDRAGMATVELFEDVTMGMEADRL